MGMNIRFNAADANISRAVDSRFVRGAVLNQMMIDMDQFVPYLSGALSQSVVMNLDATMLIYSIPYAKRQFYGVGITNYTTAVHRLAGKRWDLKAKAQYGDAWAQVAQRAIDKELKC